MKKYITTAKELTSIADKIREKTKDVEKLEYPAGFVEAIDGIGGGDNGYLCEVIDYDGTVLKSEYHKEGDIFTLPDAPTDTERLLFQEWASPVAITDNSITVPNNDVCIGAVYKTKSGLTEVDIVLNASTGLTVTLNIEGITKDWGDGTTGTATSHTYSKYGAYTIKFGGYAITKYAFGKTQSVCACVKAIYIGPNVSLVLAYAFYYCDQLELLVISKSEGDTYGFDSNVIAQFHLLKTLIFPSTTRYASVSLCANLEKVVIDAKMSEYSKDGSSGWATFPNCYNLKYAPLPDTITKYSGQIYLGNYLKKRIVFPRAINFGQCSQACENCYSLTDVIFPDEPTGIPDKCFYNCYSLESIKIPNTVKSIGSNAFFQCYHLQHVEFPDEDISYINSHAFTFCYSLKSVIFKKDVATIKGAAFQYCYNVTLYDFSNATYVTTLAASGIFNATPNTRCKFVVPDSLYDEWVAATNWSAYANYIYKASEVKGGN